MLDLGYDIIGVRAQARLAYQSETDFQTGIKKAIDWYKANMKGDEEWKEC